MTKLKLNRMDSQTDYPEPNKPSPLPVVQLEHEGPAMTSRFSSLLPVCIFLLSGCDQSECSSFCLDFPPPDVGLPGVFVDETASRLPVESNFAVRAAVGDVDNDNDLDVIVAPGGHTSTSPLPLQNFLLQINDGTGVFTNEAASRLPASAFETQIAAAVILGDVDGDLDLDAFVANGFPNLGAANFQNLLWINNGNGIFTDETSLRLPVAESHSFHAAFGDVDNDGDLDIVEGNVSGLGLSGQNKLLINNGAGVFTDETTIRLPALSDITLALALGDLDGDADLDIVVANRSFNGSKILVNNGIGFFTDQTAQRFSTPPPFAGDVVVTDVNHDGSEDIIFASESSGGPLVFINSGGGDFTEETNARTPTFSGSHGLAVADVDTDGDVDIFVTVPGTQSRLLLNDGTGFFTDASDTNLPTDSAIIRYPTFVDVDNDSDPDLYIPLWSVSGGATQQDRLLINLGRP